MKGNQGTSQDSRDLFRESQEEKRRAAGQRIDARRRYELWRDGWIKKNRQAWLDAGCPEDIRSLMDRL